MKREEILDFLRKKARENGGKKFYADLSIDGDLDCTRETEERTFYLYFWEETQKILLQWIALDGIGGEEREEEYFAIKEETKMNTLEEIARLFFSNKKFSDERNTTEK